MVPAVDDPQDLAGVEVDDGGHPRPVPDPQGGVGVTEIPHGPEPVFVDAKPPEAELVHVGHGRKQASVSGARTIPHDSATGATVSDTARPELMTASTTRSRSRAVDRDLGGGGFEECEPRAGRFFAAPAVLGPEDFHGASDRDVLDPLDAAFLPPRRHDTAGRPSLWLVGFDNDPAHCVVQNGGRDDKVVRQDAGGSVGRHNDRLSQGPWYCSRLNA
ncbi:hypothetical protein D9M72_502440 [compost metagenome]